MKNKYRVGTLSTGLLFIALGIGLLLQHWIDISFVSLLFTWWPILLILLGIEIIMYLRLQKNEAEPRVGYDFFSIFIIVIFTLVSLFLYTVKESGILNYVHSSMFTNGYTISTTPEIIDLTEVQKVIVTGQARNIELQSHQADRQLRVYSEWQHVQGENQEEATRLVEELIQTKKDGNTLYIFLSQLAEQVTFRDRVYGSFYLEIPQDVEVQVKVKNTNLQVLAQTLTANWDIQNEDGTANLWTSSEANYNILAKAQFGHIDSSDLWDTYEEEEFRAAVTKESPMATLQLINKRGWISINPF